MQYFWASRLPASEKTFNSTLASPGTANYLKELTEDCLAIAFFTSIDIPSESDGSGNARKILGMPGVAQFPFEDFDCKPIRVPTT